MNEWINGCISFDECVNEYVFSTQTYKQSYTHNSSFPRQRTFKHRCLSSQNIYIIYITYKYIYIYIYIHNVNECILG